MNKAIKMAQKSAQIDAILRVGALSDSFTQDVEDRPEQEARSVRQQKKRIIALLQQLGTYALDKVGYEEAVQQYTGLALVPEAYQAIIARLEGCVNATLPDSDHLEVALPALSDGTLQPRGAPVAA